MTKTQKNIVLDVLEQYKLMGIEYIDFETIINNNADETNLPDTIDVLKEYVENCNLCDLSKTSGICRFGMGECTSDVLIIGTNSNILNNSELNQLLKNMVEKVLMLDFNKVYYTNILKCDTSKNIDNFENEIDICLEYLIKQIEILKPKIIITFGKSFNYLMKSKEMIIDISGNIYNYKNSKLIPLFDPEFIYKNPSYKQKLFDDLKKIKLLMESL